MNRWDRLHDQVEPELESGAITSKEAYQYHTEIEQEEMDEYNY